MLAEMLTFCQCDTNDMATSRDHKNFPNEGERRDITGELG